MHLGAKSHVFKGKVFNQYIRIKAKKEKSAGGANMSTTSLCISNTCPTS